MWGLHDPRGLRAEGSAGSLYTPLDMTTPFKSASYCCVLHFYQSLGTLVIVKSVLRVIPLGWRLSSIYFFSWNLLFSDSDLWPTACSGYLPVRRSFQIFYLLVYIWKQRNNSTSHCKKALGTGVQVSIQTNMTMAWGVFGCEIASLLSRLAD